MTTLAPPSDDMSYTAHNTFYQNPSPIGTRSRGSSNASRYVPDNYLPPPPASKPDLEPNLHLAPPQHSPPAPDLRSFAPVHPDQYRPNQHPPSGIPPAQARPVHPSAYSRPSSYDPRRSGERPRASSMNSRYSDNPRSSYHSAHSHHSSYDRRSYEAGRRSAEREREAELLDRERDRARKHHQREHQRRHSHYDDGKPLKRRDTPRGYGSSLWGVFDHIKNALK